MLDKAQLKNRFREIYPGTHSPFLVRAPGRVNLIGEHTDYNGLPVLPMPIRQDIRIACAPRPDARLRLQNIDPAFPPAAFENAHEIAPSPPGAWENYCKAAIHGINRRFGPSATPGMDLLVSGSVPSRAGLSSSSALVVASALAYLKVLGKSLDTDITRLDLAALLAEAEHYVGTQGGGMDQAIILLGREGHACKINFFPLRVEPAPLLPDHAFLVCHSLVAANKTGDALHRYNAGPRLARLICALVEKQAQEDFSDEVRLDRLGELWAGHLCLTDNEVRQLFGRALPAPKTTLQQAAKRLGLTPAQVRANWLDDLPEPPDGFTLQARARHIRTESIRVEAARDALLAADPERLGALMNESHRSCAEDYKISCPELDRLVAAARKAGALGARLTGAGFGGCIVALVPCRDLKPAVEAIRDTYYGGNPPENAIFCADSAGGADYL